MNDGTSQMPQSGISLSERYGVRVKKRAVARGTFITCTMASTVAEIINKLVEHQCHHVFVVDQDGRATTVVSIANMLRIAVGID